MSEQQVREDESWQELPRLLLVSVCGIYGGRPQGGIMGSLQHPAQLLTRINAATVLWSMLMSLLSWQATDDASDLLATRCEAVRLLG